MKKIYMMDLWIYDEENVPESIGVAFAESEKDLTEIPRHELNSEPLIQEVLEDAGCESIGYVTEISRGEYEEEYMDNHTLIEL